MMMMIVMMDTTRKEGMKVKTYIEVNGMSFRWKEWMMMTVAKLMILDDDDCFYPFWMKLLKLMNLMMRPVICESFFQ